MKIKQILKLRNTSVSNKNFFKPVTMFILSKIKGMITEKKSGDYL